MKITGQGQPPIPEVDDADVHAGAAKAATSTASTASEAGAAQGTTGTAGPEGTATPFAERLGGAAIATPATAAGGAAGASGARPAVATADIAAELRAGRVSTEDAIASVIDRVVTSQVGPDAPASVREQVRAALQAAIEDDPVVAQKLRALR